MSGWQNLNLPLFPQYLQVLTLSFYHFLVILDTNSIQKELINFLSSHQTKKDFSFSFRSNVAGIFTEKWAINTTPSLFNGISQEVTVRCVVVEEDVYVKQREAIEKSRFNFISHPHPQNPKKDQTLRSNYKSNYNNYSEFCDCNQLKIQIN